MEVIDNLNDEIFCLKYELNAMSELSLYGNAERWVYKFMYESVEQDHIERYKLACGLVENKTVLDIACGSGYGSYLLSTLGNAKSIIGVDIDKDAIRYGNFRYPKENIKRIVGDACIVNFENKFDAIVSFETIEHIERYNDLIDNFHCNLADGGLLIISTPIVSKTTKNTKNPYHVIEWTIEDFRKLFHEKFEIKDAYLQNCTLHFRKPNIVLRAINKALRLVKIKFQIPTEIHMKNLVRDNGEKKNKIAKNHIGLSNFGFKKVLN